MTARIDYTPDGPTLNAFMFADDFVRCIVGPFGSGKSASCAVEVFRRAIQQKPDAKKVRRTRWAAIRSTYPQLRNTTIGSWQQWFHEGFATFRWNPTPQHHIVMPLADGTILDMRVDFIALPTLQRLPPRFPFFGSSAVFEMRVFDMQNTVAVNFAGNPAVAIPLKLPRVRKAVPVTSLQLIGPFFSEPALLNAARLVDQEPPR